MVAIFAKTDCYSPSNLLVPSATYRDFATYQLSTCRRWYAASFQAFHYHFIHETYSTVTCSESKLRSPPGQNDHSRQKQTTRWTYLFVSIILGHQYTGCASPVFIFMPRSPCFRTSDSTTWRWAHLACVPAVPASVKSPVGHGIKNMTSERCARRPSGKGPTVLHPRS